MLKLIIPKNEDIYGPESSKVFDIIGRRAAMSDVAIATGGYIGEDNHIEGDNSLKGRTGWYWNENKYNYSDALSVDAGGGKGFNCVGFRYIGVCPALQFSSIDDLTNVLSGELEDLGDGIKKGKLYVPLYVEKEIQDKLLKLDGKIKPLDQNIVFFPTDSNYYGGKPVKQKYNSYYEYEGKLYLLLDVNSCYDGEPIQFTNGEYYKDGDKIFVEVRETDVYPDENKKENGYYKAYFDKILFAGVPFDHTGVYPDDFEKSDMRRYLDVYWQELEKLQSVVRKIRDKGQSNWETNPENDVLATTDILKEAQNLANYFTQLCVKSASLEKQIRDIREQLANAEKDKKDTDKQIKSFRELMNQGGTEDGRQ